MPPLEVLSALAVGRDDAVRADRCGRVPRRGPATRASPTRRSHCRPLAPRAPAQAGHRFCSKIHSFCGSAYRTPFARLLAQHNRAYRTPFASCSAALPGPTAHRAAADGGWGSACRVSVGPESPAVGPCLGRPWTAASPRKSVAGYCAPAVSGRMVSAGRIAAGLARTRRRGWRTPRTTGTPTAAVSGRIVSAGRFGPHRGLATPAHLKINLIRAPFCGRPRPPPWLAQAAHRDADGGGA